MSSLDNFLAHAIGPCYFVPNSQHKWLFRRNDGTFEYEVAEVRPDEWAIVASHKLRNVNFAAKSFCRLEDLARGHGLTVR